MGRKDADLNEIFFEAFKCLAQDNLCIYKLILVAENIKINSKTKLGFGQISVGPSGRQGPKFCRPERFSVGPGPTGDGFGDL